jgi:hypothetical protein
MDGIRLPKGGIANIKGKPIDFRALNYTRLFRSASYTPLPITTQVTDPTTLRCCNKLEKNFHLANKKALFSNLKCYYELLGKDPFAHMPITFHISTGETDPAYTEFV